MILIDTSAWIEFLRDTRSPVCERVDQLLSSRFATCDVVRMEVFAGARDTDHAAQLRRLLARGTPIAIEPIDFDTAASLYRRCRDQGVTVRKLVDCLIAATALRAGATLLHMDRDFTAIASATGLRVDDL